MLMCSDETRATSSSVIQQVFSEALTMILTDSKSSIEIISSSAYTQFSDSAEMRL